MQKHLEHASVSSPALLLLFRLLLLAYFGDEHPSGITNHRIEPDRILERSFAIRDVTIVFKRKHKLRIRVVLQELLDDFLVLRLVV